VPGYHPKRAPARPTPRCAKRSRQVAARESGLPPPRPRREGRTFLPTTETGQKACGATDSPAGGRPNDRWHLNLFPKQRLLRRPSDWAGRCAKSLRVGQFVQGRNALMAGPSRPRPRRGPNVVGGFSRNSLNAMFAQAPSRFLKSGSTFSTATSLQRSRPSTVVLGQSASKFRARAARQTMRPGNFTRSCGKPCPGKIVPQERSRPERACVRVHAVTQPRPSDTKAQRCWPNGNQQPTRLVRLQ